MIKVVLVPFAIASWLVLGLPRAALTSWRARRRLRHGQPRILLHA
jgi:hypothetical protein